MPHVINTREAVRLPVDGIGLCACAGRPDHTAASGGAGTVQPLPPAAEVVDTLPLIPERDVQAAYRASRFAHFVSLDAEKRVSIRQLADPHGQPGLYPEPTRPRGQPDAQAFTCSRHRGAIAGVAPGLFAKLWLV